MSQFLLGMVEVQMQVVGAIVEIVEIATVVVVEIATVVEVATTVVAAIVEAVEVANVEVVQKIFQIKVIEVVQVATVEFDSEESRCCWMFAESLKSQQLFWIPQLLAPSRFPPRQLPSLWCC